MLWIGLTGGLATGKSTVAKILREKGYPVVDADLLAREALSPGKASYDQVVKTFGPTILSADGSVDRKVLGELVFADRRKLRQLEAITHPEIRNEQVKAKLQLEAQGHKLAFYDVPLLFEKQLEDMFDAIVVVYAPESVQLERALRRDQHGEHHLRDRLSNQVPIEIKKTKTPYVISNNGDLASLKAEVIRVISELEKLS